MRGSGLDSCSYMTHIINKSMYIGIKKVANKRKARERSQFNFYMKDGARRQMSLDKSVAMGRREV